MKKVASRSQLYADPKGRSMLEMLGVLVIIAVLSVGAIAGYGKAMMKYRLNKQSEQISWLLNVMYRYKSEFGKRPSFQSLVPYFIKLGEIPENMRTKYTYLRDVFNSAVDIQTNSCHDNGCNEVGMFYTMSSSESFEMCQNLLNVAKEFGNQLYRIGISKDGATNTEYSSTYLGSRYCTNSTKCLKNMTQDEIYEQCSFCTKGSANCRMFMLYRIND